MLNQWLPLVFKFDATVFAEGSYLVISTSEIEPGMRVYIDDVVIDPPL